MLLSMQDELGALDEDEMRAKLNEAPVQGVLGTVTQTPFVLRKES